ncbi:MAG: DUF1320 domain-containing protein [Burkholderiales bacterium]|nr:DUF1320 domain-containing protein [Burkholderiales bacterium]
MPVYATRQEMIDRFGEAEIRQLTDRRDPPAGAIDDTVLDGALADADGMVDSYLAGRYQLPLASVPKILKRYACDIARYFLWKDNAGDTVRRAYEDAEKFLKAVAAGTVALGLDASNQPVAVADGGVSFNESRRVFGGEREIG